MMMRPGLWTRPANAFGEVACFGAGWGAGELEQPARLNEQARLQHVENKYDKLNIKINNQIKSIFYQYFRGFLEKELK